MTLVELIAEEFQWQQQVRKQPGLREFHVPRQAHLLPGYAATQIAWRRQRINVALTHWRVL